MEYYLAIKKSALLLYATSWVDLYIIMPNGETRQKKGLYEGAHLYRR